MCMRFLGTGESDLLAALHEGMFDLPMWNGFLHMLASVTGASLACLMLRHGEGPMIRLLAGAERVSWHPLLDEKAEGALPYRHMRDGRVYALPELTDLMQPSSQAMPAPLASAHARSMRIIDPGGAEAWLTILGDTDPGASAASLMSRLAPHMRIALRGFAALERERARASISTEMMGRLNFGWLTLDARCRILDQSPNMDGIFRRSSLLRRGRYDRLTFTPGTIDREVAALVKTFGMGADSRPRVFCLSRDPWMDIFVTPAAGERFAAHGPATAIVYVSGDRWSQDDRREQLHDLFGLLPSEARLAWAIAQGRSIAAAADELGITVETARNYSKKIYSKMGVSGQAELVRVIFTSVLAII